MKRMVVSMALAAAILVLGAANAGAQPGSRGITVYSGDGGSKLGVSLQDVTPRLKERKKLAVGDGAYVVSVGEDSPAETAGIEDGDVIVKFDGKEVRDADDLTRAVKRAGTDEQVSVELNRKGEKKTLSVKLRKPRRSNSYSYSYGGGRGFEVVPPTAPTPPRSPRIPRSFRFNFQTSQSVEGMDVQELSKQLAEYFEVPGGRGLLVTEVDRRSAAADAGVKAGDVIVKVNSFSVKDIDDLREGVYEKEKNTVQLEILRKGKSQSVTLKVEEYDEDEGEEDEEDLSFDMGVPSLPHRDHSISRGSFSDANRIFLRELHETLSQVQEQIREKMQRLQVRITKKVLNL